MGAINKKKMNDLDAFKDAVQHYRFATQREKIDNIESLILLYNHMLFIYQDNQEEITNIWEERCKR